MENTTIYNKNLETVADRIDHVAASLNADTVNRRVRELVKQGVTMAENGLGKHLSEIANYIMEAKDIKTNRKIEQSYYKSEKEYGHYKQAKTALVDDTSKLDYLADESLEQQREPESCEDELNLVGLNLDKISKYRNKIETGKDVQRFIEMYNKFNDFAGLSLVTVLGQLLFKSLEVGTEKELEVFSLRWQGKSAAETAEIRNISVHQVQKQYKNVCDKIAAAIKKE